jgi:hypothetical protein
MGMTVTIDGTVIAALVVWSALFFWLGRASGGGRSRDLSGAPPHMQPQRPAPAPVMPSATPPSEGLSPGRLEAVRGALAGGNKIMAIKLYREATGVGLAKAKEAVEAMER